MKVTIEKNARILAIFAIVCTATVGLVHLLTADRIAEQQQRYLLSSLNNIIAPERYNNDLFLDCSIIEDQQGTSQKVYLARFNEQPVAAAFTATAPDGYNGNIELLVAINIDNSVSGVRVLTHNETPGLGDKIEIRKSDWITTFTNKIVEDENDMRWFVTKDGGMFDQFTGATITPRAVVKSVRQTALYFAKNKEQLFNSSANCYPKAKVLDNAEAQISNTELDQTESLDESQQTATPVENSNGG